MKRPPLVLIEWEDAYNGNHDWEDMDLVLGDQALVIETVGFEIAATPERTTLAMSWRTPSLGRPAQVCDLFTIPAGMIRGRRVLR